MLFERNGKRHDLLAGDPVAEVAAAQARKSLSDDWDIKNKSALLQRLQKLERDGHRKEFAEVFKLIEQLPDEAIEKPNSLVTEHRRRQLAVFRKHAPRVKSLKAGFLGWDYAHYVALCRWGYAAAYLSEQDPWKRMDKVVPALQKAYASWEELGEVFCIGRERSNPVGDHAETWKAFEKLRSDEASPWKTTSWDLKLTPLDKPPKPPAK